MKWAGLYSVRPAVALGRDTNDPDSTSSRYRLCSLLQQSSSLTESGVVDGFAGVYSDDDDNDQPCQHAEDQGQLGVSAYLQRGEVALKRCHPMLHAGSEALRAGDASWLP